MNNNNPYKNQEGYNDHTAGKAITYLETKLPPQKKGEVWTVSNPDYTKDPDRFLVVAAQTNGWINCLECKDIKYMHKNEWSVEIGHGLFVDARNIWSKPSKYFLDKDYSVELPKVFDIDKAIFDSLMLTVPVLSEEDDIVIDESDDIFTELKLLAQKADIYERCFNAIAGRR